MRPSLVLVVAGLMILLVVPCAWAAERIRVTSVDVKALEAMIKTTPGHLLAVVTASWCVPCLKEIPSLNNLAAKYGPKGLKIIGISVDLDGPDPMQAVADNLKVVFPIYWVGEPGLEAMQIAAIPMMMVIRDGTVVERIIGVRSEAELEKKIRGLLN